MNIPIAVPTTSWPLRTATALACTFGKLPEMFLNVLPAFVDLNTCPLPTFSVLSPTAPIGAKKRDALAPSVTYTVRGCFGSGATPVMIRFGSPLAAAMCQPSEVIRFGGLLPPTFVAKPTWNSRWRLTGSQSPQKPTYARSPDSAAADEWLGASGSSTSASLPASASPGWPCVPRSHTY